MKGAVFSSYLRSLIIYFFTPCIASGLLKLSDASSYEALMRRKLLGLPNDVKSSTVLNLTSQYDRTTQHIISQQVSSIKKKLKILDERPE